MLFPNSQGGLPLGEITIAEALVASPDFQGTSRAGIYGDAVEELDWSVGQVPETLRHQGLAERTLVVFTSDNGSWLIMGNQGGSAGLQRDGTLTLSGVSHQASYEWRAGT